MIYETQSHVKLCQVNAAMLEANTESWYVIYMLHTLVFASGVENVLLSICMGVCSNFVPPLFPQRSVFLTCCKKRGEMGLSLLIDLRDKAQLTMFPLSPEILDHQRQAQRIEACVDNGT